MAYEEKRNGRYTGVFIGEVVLPPVMGRRTKVRERFKTRGEAERWEGIVRQTGTIPNRLEHAKSMAEGQLFGEVADRLDRMGGPGGAWARAEAKAKANGGTGGVLKGGVKSDALRRAAVRKRFATTPIKSISYTMAEDWITELRKARDVSPSTINRYLSALSSYLTYAEQSGVIERTPKLPWQRESRKRQPHYSDDAIVALLAELRARGHDVDATACEVLSCTGLRVGELLGLEARQIDDEGYITLDDPERIKNGETRVVHVGQTLGRSLRAIVANNRLPSYAMLRRRVARALKSAGYETARPLHAFRHTAATRTVAVEQDLQIAQQLLGHRSSKTTERYRHISPEVMRERAKKVSQHAGQNKGEVVAVDFTQPRQLSEKAS